MGKTKINIKFLLLLLLAILSNMLTHSQALFTKELQWKNCDSIEIPYFQSQSQIIEWGKNFGSYAFVRTENFCIKEFNIFFLLVDLCSGIYCPNIYIFREIDEHWHCLMYTNARLKEKIEIKIDNNQGIIIFEIKSGKIGELSFSRLILNSDKTKY